MKRSCLGLPVWFFVLFFRQGVFVAQMDHSFWQSYRHFYHGDHGDTWRLARDRGAWSLRRYAVMHAARALR